MKKVFIRTYGCQMNVYDSDRMAHSLTAHGYSKASGPEDADLVILNTCHIREKAAEKVYSELGRLRLLRDRRRAAAGGDMLLAVAGCVAQAEGAMLLERAPFVDVVVGPQPTTACPSSSPSAAAPAAGWSTPTSRLRASSTSCPKAWRRAGSRPS